MSNWYVSALASGGGIGSEEDPFTLAEMFSLLGSTIVGGNSVWIKDDGIYTTSGNNEVNPVFNHILIKGYSFVIGDNGKATIQMTNDNGIVIIIRNEYCYRFENLIFDGNNRNNIGINSFSYQTIINNVEFKNSLWGYNGNGIIINSVAHDNEIGFSGDNQGQAKFDISVINSIAYDNSDTGMLYCKAFNCICKNNYYTNFACILVVNCIADGGQTGVVMLGGAIVENVIIINCEYGLNFDITQLCAIVRNIDFYNCDSNSENINWINTYYELNPQFKDPDNFDYTRIGDNLVGKGFSKVGLLTEIIDYKLDIGIGGIEQMTLAELQTELDARDLTKEQVDKITTILQVEKGKWEIVDNKLIMYAENGIDILYQFNLKDSNGNMISCKIRIYPIAEDVENDTNPIDTYTVTATYNVSNKIISYKVKKDV